QAWKTCPPEKVGYTAVAVLRGGQPTERQFARVEGWLNDALRKDPALNGLRVCLADLADLQGKYELAEKYYREVLVRDRRNLEALNNLAWQLAFRNEEAKRAESLQRANEAYSIMKEKPRQPLPEILDTRALARMANGDASSAITDLLDAAQLPASD